MVIYFPTSWKCLISIGSIQGMGKIQTNLWTHRSCFPTFNSKKIDDHQTLRRPFNYHILKGFSKGTWWSGITQPNYKLQIINHFIISQLIIHSCSWSIHKQSMIHVHDHHGLPYLTLKISSLMRFQNIITQHWPICIFWDVFVMFKFFNKFEKNGTIILKNMSSLCMETKLTLKVVNCTIDMYTQQFWINM
jgi:hypothetical protein